MNSGVVLVTGASRGIGAATAHRFAADGSTVIRLARSALPPLRGARDYRVDLADPTDRGRVLQLISEEIGLPDIVVSNAGAFLLAPIEDTSDALLREQLAINLEAPLAIARHFLPAMCERGTGSHLLVGSVADHKAYPGNAAYAASKFGARGLHEVLLEECRGTGVRCTLISPGPTDTSVWDPLDPDSRGDLPNRADMLCVDDVAAAIYFAATQPGHVQIEEIRMGASR
ncbi:MAG: SDR family NAD(P)-dependent oxidoreductase [Gemmatimonadales bacterium]